LAGRANAVRRQRLQSNARRDGEGLSCATVEIFKFQKRSDARALLAKTLRAWCEENS
jgi:hypothetical protein